MALARHTLTLLLALGAAAGCFPSTDQGKSSESAEDAAGAAWLTRWSPEARATWYGAPPGSHLIDYQVFLALARAGDNVRFADRSNLSKYGFSYPPDGDPVASADGLPLGMLKDRNEPEDRDDLGFTCAACHTGTLRVGERRFLVDGGQSFLRFQPFLTDLERAMVETLADGERLDSFCAALGGTSTCQDRLALASARVQGILNRNASPEVEEGPGRLDTTAFVSNEVFGGLMQDGAILRGAVAPLSYPFLWSTPRLKCTHTNCLATNPLGRNIAAMLGVFGHAELTRGDDGHVHAQGGPRVKTLFDLEEALTSLQSPQWDERAFGAIDRDAAARGEALYAASCEGCHARPWTPQMDPATLERSDPSAFAQKFFKEEVHGRTNYLWNVVTIPYTEVGTDGAFMDDLLGRWGKTGDDQGVIELFDDQVRALLRDKLREELGFAPPDALVDAAFLAAKAKEVVSGLRRIDLFGRNNGSVLSPVLLGVLAQGVSDTYFDGLGLTVDQKNALVTQYTFNRVQSADVSLKNYRARPLDGIAFTAPFGHNGAWPTLRDMLEPPERRPARFRVAPGSFDTKKVGLDVDTSGADAFVFDASVAGNRNGGHLYGTSLRSEEKDDLVEFLKTL
jgi:hypothetical protein